MSKIATLFVAVMLTFLIATPLLHAQTDTVFFSIQPEDVTLNQGEQATFDILVSEFNDVVAFQYVILWDTTILEFVEVTNLSPDLPGLNVGFPGAGAAPNGQITASYINLQLIPTSIPDGSLIMSMTFEGIGPECSSTTFEIPPGDIEVGQFINNQFITAEGIFTTATANMFCSGGGCGINGLGDATFVCLDSTLGNNNDGVQVEIAYEGMDPQAMVISNGGGTIAGDDPASVMNGTIIIEGLQEGDPWNIAVTGGNCNLSSSGTIPADLCNPPPCGVSVLQTSNEVTIICNDSTAGPDGVILEIGYTGMDPNAVLTNNLGGMIGGDDPAQVMDGTILITGLSEGDVWDIDISGGSCMLQSTGIVPADACPQPCLISGLSTELLCQDTSLAADPVLVEISYLGQDPDVIVVNNGGGAIGGDDPAMTPNGTITLSGLEEGDNYNVSITGGGCDLMVSGSIPTDLCVPDPCGIVDIATGNEANFTCQDSTAADDGVVVEIDYFGSDPNAILTNNGGGVIGGDDPAVVNNGTILITGLVEGEAWDIQITGGTCNLQSTGSIPANLCPEPGCGISALESGMDVGFMCTDSTGNADTVVVQINYTGSDPDAMVVNNAGGTIGGDDPASVADGTITVTITEGEDWDISITGGVCNLQSTGTVPADLCPAPTCGIVEVESGMDVAITCDMNTASADPVTIEIAYAGLDPEVSIVNNGAGTIGGDDPAAVADGVILITDILEGEDWDISLTGGACDLQSTGTVPGDLCSPALCGVSDLASGSEVDVVCLGATTGTDEVELLISYTGVDPEATLVNNAGGTLEGDDPATDPDGIIVITGLSEGDSWDIEITGGNCNLSSTGTVDANDCIAELTIDIGEVSGAPGDTVCVDVYAENFIDLLGLEYAVIFDTSKLDFVQVQNFEVQGMSESSFNHPANSDKIFLSWSLFAINGATVPDSTVIYQMCFEIIDTVNMTTPLAIDTAGVIEAAMAGSPPTSVPVTTVEGEVEIVAPSNELTISLNCENGAVGDTVCVEVLVQNFEDIIGLEYTVEWDAARLAFVEVADFAFSSLSSGNFSQNGNQLVLSWSPLASTGETLADGSVLYRMCFEIVGGAGTSVPLSFTGTTEATQAGMPPQQIPINVQGCSIDISGGQTGGDLSISIGDGAGDCENIVCVDVTVENFEDILGLEYTIQWDPSVLQFDNVEGFNLPGLSTGNFNQVGNNQLIISWNNNTGVTRPDGAVIYRICFLLQGDADDVSELAFVGNVEATQAGLPPIQVDPVVTNDGQITIDNCGGGGTDDFTIAIGDASGDCENTVCVDITVENFENILGLEYTIQWDPAVVQFSSVEGFNLPSLSSANFNEIGNDQLILSWNNNTGVTRPDGSVIYRMCFLLVGDASEVSNLTFNGTVEATAAGTPPTLVDPIVTNEGQITVENCGGGNPGDLTISVADASGECGNTVCVNVTVDNFDDIIGLEYTISWDASVLDFVNVEGFNLPSLSGGNFNQIGNSLIVSWNNNTAVTRPDGTAIYQMCFNLVGDENDVSALEFTGTVEATQGGTPPTQVDPVLTNDGQITISNCGGGGPGDLRIIIDEDMGANGDTLCLDVSVENFNDILGLEYTIDWDPAVVEFVNVEGFNLPSLSGGNFNQIGNSLIFSWNNNSPVSRPDGTVIYRLCFRLIGGQDDVTGINFVGNAEATSGPPPSLVPIDTDNGQITITEGVATSDLTIDIGNAIGENGDTVCVDIEVTNFEDITGLEYTVDWDPAVVDFINVEGFNLPSLSGGNFNQIGNSLIFSWNNNTGVTRPNGTVIYRMCFEIVGATGDESPVSFTGQAEATQGTLPPMVVPVEEQNGLIEVTGNFAGLTLYAECPNANPGDEVCIPIRVDGFDDIFGGQFSMNWDPTVLQFSMADNFNPDVDGLVADNVNLISAGTALFQWTDPFFDGVTLPDGSIFFEMCFEVVGDLCDTTTFQINGDPNEIEFGTIIGVQTLEVPVLAQSCLFEVNGCNGPQLQENIENTRCVGDANGAISLTVDGISPFTYEWSGLPMGNDAGAKDQTDLPAGEYCVTVTDANGLTSDACYQVDEPQEIEITATIVDETCSEDCDGAIILNVSGGTAPFDYNWGDLPGNTNAKDRSDLCDGEYCVTVTDANDCTQTACFTVAAGQVLNLSADITDADCTGGDNGAIGVQVTGTINITYNWDPPAGNTGSLFGLMPGTYCVTVTDDVTGCQVDSCFEVEEIPSFTVTTSVDNVSCNGGNDGRISLFVDGMNNDYSFEWANPITTTTSTVEDLEAGTYMVTITDNVTGCTSAQSITLTEPDAIVIELDSVNNLLCANDFTGAIFTTVSGGTTPYTAQWFDEDGTLAGGTLDIGNLLGGCYDLVITDANGCTATLDDVCIDEPEPLDIDASLDNPTEGMCDGAINLEVSGGTGPYTYTWDNGLPGNPDHTDLCPGVYCVTITDANNCQLAGCYSLFCPLKIDTFEVTDPICFGDTSGAIDITPTCGVPPYSFLWSNSETTEDLENVDGGAYTVTITDDLGNTFVSDPIVVASPQPISVSNISIQSASCDPNGAINITVSGGTPTYTYQWSNGQTSEDISMLESDSFMVTITDVNGCMFISPNYFVPFEPDAPLIEEVDVTPVSCFGAADGSAMVTASGCVLPFEYFWVSNMTGDTVSLNVNPNNLAAGEYTLIVVDDLGQETSQTVTVNQPNPISIILDSVIHESCPDGENGQIFINVGGGNPGGYTYAWNSITSTNQDPGGLSAGSYQVTVTDSKGCTAQSNAFQVNPLPPCICAAEVSSVSCPGETDGSISLSMCDMGLSFQFNWSQGDTLTIPGTGPSISNLPPGQYYVTITDPTTGATETAIYAVLEPDDWSTQATVNPADECFTGSIDLNVSGANGNYTYSWNDGATTQDREDLPAGEWSVTITDGSGCTFTNSYLVEGPPCTEAIVSDENCDGDADGAIDLTAYGIEPVQIQWQLPNGSTVNTEDLGSLAPGEYVVVVTDNNGMTTTDTFTIETLSFLEATVEINSLPSCFQDDDGSVTAIGLNGSGNLSFEWCNGATVPTAGGLSAGPCSVTVSDGVGCEVTVDFELDNEPLEFTTQQETCFEDCDGRIQVLPQGGTGPYQFAWDDPLNQSTPIAQELCAGQYTVTVTDALGRNCIVDAELQPVDSISIFFEVTPARVRDGAVLAIPENGTPPYQYLWDTGQNGSRISGLAAGTYMVTVIDDNGCVSRATVEVPGDFDCGTARKIITPNRDGFNDFFIIQCADMLDNQLAIFNRWGELVYEATNYSNDWEGVNLDGELLPEDGYFYIFDYTEQGEVKQIKGSITIIRE